MKKIISVVLLLALCIGCFAGCAPKEDAALNAAKEYLYTMYKDAEEKTAVDYTVVSQVRIDDVTYPITWTTDVSEDKVKITAGENNMTIVDINEATAEQIDYNLTATLKNADGLEASVSFKHFIPKADGLPATLADGTYVILSGNLTMSSLTQDKNYGYPVGNEVTVTDGAVSGHVEADVLTIKNVDGGFTIQDAYGRYFYLQGTYNSFNVDATAPAEGHIFSILVKDGKYLIQNNLDKKTLAYSTSYSSWGCYPELSDDHNSAVDIIAATGGAEEAPGYDPTGKTPAEIIDAAYALESGKAMSAAATLTGVISAVDTPWDDGYQNITVTIKVAGKEDKPIVCFRMKGDGAKDLKVGDTITCTGIIKNYNGTIEFDAGCQVSNIVAGAVVTPPATNPPATNPKPTTPPANTPKPTTPPATTPKPTTPPATNPPATSSKVTFSYPKENKFVTGKHYAYTSSSGKTKMELELSEKKADALAMEKITNSDNTVSFKAGGQYLFCDGTDVKFVSSQSDNTKFVLESADGGYYIKCAVANYQGKAQYLEVYNGYLTCYGMGTDTSIYVFKLDNTTGANGKISAQDGSNAGSSSSGGSSSSSGSSSSGSIGNLGTAAASLNLLGTTTRTSYSTEKTVHSANGITYTNDRASNTNGNYDQQSNFAARAYKGSTIKIEYAGMTKILLTLDSFSDGKYLTGFDGMEVSGATIIRDNDRVLITFASATNAFQSTELLSQVRINSIDVYTK